MWPGAAGAKGARAGSQLAALPLCSIGFHYAARCSNCQVSENGSLGALLRLAKEDFRTLNQIQTFA